MPAIARVGDNAQCPSDTHGNPLCCPHPTMGPATTGSPDVMVNGAAVLRVGDHGIHSTPCCGPNTWVVGQGSATVFVNGLAVARLGDQTVHCGGVGNIISGSANLDVGG